jgi:hypothetical protein
VTSLNKKKTHCNTADLPQMKKVSETTVTEPPLDELNETVVVESDHTFVPLSSMPSFLKGHISSLHQNHSMSEM